MSAGADDRDDELHDVGPDPDRPLVDRLVDIIEDVPTLTQDDLREMQMNKYRNSAFWDDETINTAALERKYRPATLGLPGFGDPYDGSDGNIPCGTEIPHVCEHCGERIDVGSTCGRSRCPRCGAAWVLKRAPGIVNRIWSAAKMKETTQYLHHGVISPPPEVYVDDEDPEQALKDAVKDMMRALDMDGIALYHSFTGKSDEGEGFEESHQDDRGEWKHRLFEGRNWEGDVREELQHRPHFHVIGATSYFPGGGRGITKRVYDQTGWVIHRITERNGSNRSLSTFEKLARAVTYALSHTAIDTRGERNRYVHSKIGSDYHNADDRHLAQARDAVHKVAPDTLGIPRMEIECQSQVPKDERDHSDPVSELIDDQEGAEPESTSSDDGSKTVPCRGDLVDVDDADFVDEPAWQRAARYADEAIEARREWEDVGGWQEWIGQATLDVDDDPPPD